MSISINSLVNSSSTTVPTFITDASGDGVASLTPTFVLKCLSSTVALNVGKFYNFNTSSWDVAPYENILPAVSGIPGAYSYEFSQSSVGVGNDVYFVRVNTTVNTTTDHAFIFKYGSSIEDKLNALIAVVAPAREEIHRVTNDVVEIAYFNADDVEVQRFRITHDPSGAQPEQTKEEI